MLLHYFLFIICFYQKLNTAKSVRCLQLTKIHVSQVLDILRQNINEMYHTTDAPGQRKCKWNDGHKIKQIFLMNIKWAEHFIVHVHMSRCLDQCSFKGSLQIKPMAIGPLVNACMNFRFLCKLSQWSLLSWVTGDLFVPWN